MYTKKSPILLKLRKHYSIIQFLDQSCTTSNFHNIMYVILKLCYEFRIENNEKMADILQRILKCEHTFDRLLLGLLMGPNSSYYICGWKSDFRNETNPLQVIEYFVRAANLYRLRLLDKPLDYYDNYKPFSLCLNLNFNDDYCLLLLRFGADFSIGSNEKEFIFKNFNLRCLDFLRMSCLGFNKFSLKETARVRIRHILYDNFQLPDGVLRLNCLPCALRRFLNFC